ncbi:MAG: hypothetical protein KGR25_03625, partial [Chloroflexi bacterium]|nr:hypothetical protein [Chloroflexota bacterium]
GWGFNSNFVSDETIEAHHDPQDGPFDANSVYHWEIFYHLPMLLSKRLLQARRFELALKWVRSVVDPFELREENPWRFSLFRRTDPTDLEDALSGDYRRIQKAAAAFREQLNAISRDPFDPHAVARLRPLAYQRAALMQMLDVLIGWGDHLYQQFTAESVNEAALLFVTAGRLLGPQRNSLTESVSAPSTPPTLDQALSGTTAFGVGFENLATSLDSDDLAVADADLSIAESVHHSLDLMNIHPAFCLPDESRWNTYRQVVADRLFKIRHCQDIDGAQRSLALFEPPIDPALLVRAAAAGLNLSDAIASVTGAVSTPYRFVTLVSRAKELVNLVRGFGQELLAAFEKMDAEHLTWMQQRHSLEIAERRRLSTQFSIDDLDEQIKALQFTREAAEKRKAHHEAQKELNKAEKDADIIRFSADRLREVRAVGLGITQILVSLPNFEVGTILGFLSGFTASTRAGGETAAPVQESIRLALDTTAEGLETAYRYKSLKGSRERARDDQNMSAGQAELELRRLEHDEIALQLRRALQVHELETNERIQGQTQEVVEYVRDKFTSKELYGWMAGQLRTLYSETFRLALRAAREAESAFARELDVRSETFVGASQWDAGREGLLAGHKLQVELEQLHTAYLERNTRTRVNDVEQTIPLSILDPNALMSLKAAGITQFEITELFLDSFFPGDFDRRIQSVSVSILGQQGPLSSLAGSFRLDQAVVRRTMSLASYAPLTSVDDAGTSGQHTDLPPFALNEVRLRHGRVDSGIFDDTAQDGRYLPFEGAGLVSKWSLDVETGLSGFDSGSISDVLLHVRYQAKHTNAAVVRSAVEIIAAAAPRYRAFDVLSVYSDTIALVERTDVGDAAQFTFSARFPSADRLQHVPPGVTLKVTEVKFHAYFDHVVSTDGWLATIASAETDFEVDVTSDGHVVVAQMDYALATPPDLFAGSELTLSVTVPADEVASLPAALNRCYVVIGYVVTT